MKKFSTFQKTFEEISKKIDSNENNEFDFQKARHEVFKFGISGLNPTDKKEAKVALAISLGAKVFHIVFTILLNFNKKNSFQSLEKESIKTINN